MRRALLLLIGLCLASSCKTSSSEFGTESHFLMECSQSEECGGQLNCIDGICTRACDGNSECQELLESSACVESSGEVPGGTRCDVLCTRDNQCSALGATSCVAGRCRHPSSAGDDTGSDDTDVDDDAADDTTSGDDDTVSDDTTTDDSSDDDAADDTTADDLGDDDAADDDTAADDSDDDTEADDSSPDDDTVGDDTADDEGGGGTSGMGGAGGNPAAGAGGASGGAAGSGELCGGTVCGSDQFCCGPPECGACVFLTQGPQCPDTCPNIDAGTVGQTCPGFREDLGFDTCLSQDDCLDPSGPCLRLADLPPQCGGPAPSECESCEGGEICTTPDVCGNSFCVPPCTQDSCAGTETCTDGLCIPKTCDEPGATPCSDEHSCQPNDPGANELGCVPIPCGDDWQCPPTATCGEMSAPRADIHGCIPDPCTIDEDCACGFCIEGGCEPEQFICQPPPAP